MSTPLQHGSNDSTNKDYGVQNVEERGSSTGTTEGKRTFGQKAKRHCARFWWLHLIIFCVIFLVVALLVVYVGMPKIAQHQVNDASLEILDNIYDQPTSMSVVLTQKAILHNPSSFTPSFDPFDAAFYVVENGTYNPAPAFNLPIPSLHATKSTPTSIDQKFIQFLDIDQVSAFTIMVITKEWVTTALVGKTKLHLGKLPVQTVQFNTTSKYKGLNGLKGFNTTDLRINITAPAGTPNLKGMAQVPNASQMTILMGNITLELATEKAGVVGTATISDFTLRPGMNSYPMSATVNQSLVLGSLNSEGKVNMSITGRESVYNGQHLTYYERALSSNKLILEMNIAQILKDSAPPQTSSAAPSATPA